MTTPAAAAQERLLGLLGLARRAGKLAVGATAVTQLVRSGARPVVVIAGGVGASQHRKLTALRPVRGVVDGLVDRDEMAHRLGRNDLVVVAVADRGFVAGLMELGLVREGSPAPDA